MSEAETLPDHPREIQLIVDEIKASNEATEQATYDNGLLQEAIDRIFADYSGPY